MELMRFRTDIFLPRNHGCRDIRLFRYDVPKSIARTRNFGRAGSIGAAHWPECRSLGTIITNIEDDAERHSVNIEVPLLNVSVLPRIDRI